MVYNIGDFGARGDAEANDAAAIQAAVDRCHEAGGGTVLVPAGKTFLSGTFSLRSRVCLHLEAGARIISSKDRAHFRGDETFLIEVDDCEDIAITGQGTIDGRGVEFMEEDLRYIYRPQKWRPRLIGFIGCRRVTITGVTLRDAASWCVHLVGCDDVSISGIRILNNLRVPNCDGIDPDHCRNVRISNCHIEAGDDCVVIKNTHRHSRFGPSENIIVSGCTLVSTSAALKIGTESVDDFRNIIFDSCVIRGSSRGLAIQLRDQGNVEDVIFSNMTVETRLFEEHWWGHAEPIYVTALKRFGEQAPQEDLPPWNAENRLGRVRRVRFSNILCRGENGAFIAGSPSSPIEDLVLDNVSLELNKTSKWPGGKHDRRPCDKLGPDFRDPSKDPGLTDHHYSGVFIEQAQQVLLRNVSVNWGPNRPDWFAHALETRQVQDLVLRDFRGESAHPRQLHAQQLG